MVLLNNLHDTYSKYFDILSKKGNINTDVRKQLILLDFIIWLLEEEPYILKEEEHAILNNHLYNILGSSCIFSYSDYIESKNINQINTNFKLRITEDGEIRDSYGRIRII